MNKSFFTGVVLALIASLSWGGLAVSVQYLFQVGQFPPLGLSNVRLLGAGTLMVILGFVIRAKNMDCVFRRPSSLVQIALSGVLVYCSHMTFFLAVYYSNAGSGAIYLATVPLLSALWLSVIEKRPLSVIEALCFVLAALGVALVVTDGDITSLKFSPLSIFWGCLSALSAVCYALYPRRVMQREGVTPVVCWGIFFGGLASSIATQPWHLDVVWTLPVILNYSYVVLFGTVLAFWCYLASLSRISPVIVGLIVCLEPASAFVFGAWILNEAVGLAQAVGVGLVLANVVLLTLASKRR